MTPAPRPTDRARRYPGVRSFDDDEIHRHLFRGRDNDKYDLLQLVLAERLVVLFARSGIGKSSLINAGLMQPLRERGFFPAVVRVSSVAHDPLDSSYRGVKAACDRAIAKQEVAECEPSDSADWNKTSLWHFFKTFDIWGPADKLLQPVLIVDQFEELFTVVSEEPRTHFIDELADLIRGTRPGRSSARAEQEAAALDDAPPYVKVVLVVREDFMAHLEELAERIPTILKARYRLGPLDVEQAKRAIVEPAQLDLPTLATAPFTWSEDALKCTLDFLCKRVSGRSETATGNEVEPFQLQLVCQFVEELVAKQRLTTVGIDDLGGEQALHGILTRFYADSIDKLCAKFAGFRLRRRLENFCEYGLITDSGRRLLREESDIERSNRVSPEVLTEMVQLRLLRKEPRIGDRYYELTHDTLIAPVLASRQKREGERRWQWTAGGFVIVVAVAALFFAMNQRVADARLEAQQATTELAWETQRRAWETQRRDVERADALIEQARLWAIKGSSPLEDQFYTAAVRNGAKVDLLDEEVKRSIMSGNMLAANGDVKGALEAYRSAADAAGTSADLRATIPREQLRIGEMLARGGYVTEALELYEAARTQYDGELISGSSWNTLCWAGGVYEQPDDVLAACQRAVEKQSSDGGIRDSRGLALATARNGNLEQAKDDFLAYVAWARKGARSNDEIATREGWIAALDLGRNPFDEETRKTLREEEESTKRFADSGLRREFGPGDSELLASLGLLLEAWSLDPDLQRRLQAPGPSLCESLQQIESCDKRWEAKDLPGMEQVTMNACSTTLAALVDKGSGAPSEVFVTNAEGFNVCVSGNTSDYYQADEEWWKAAVENRKRTDSQFERDQSTGNAFSYSVAVAIRDAQSQQAEVLGVMKAVFEAKSLSNTIK